MFFLLVSSNMHSSLPQYSAAGGNEADLLPLLLGLVPHPQKARAQTDRHKSLSKWLLVERLLSWGRGWSWAPLGLLLPSQRPLLSSGGPDARSMLPSLGERWWRNTDPGQAQCFCLLSWMWKLFCYCPFQKEWFCCFQLMQLHNPVSIWYDNSM